MPHLLEYQVPPGKRMHNSEEFVLAPATFRFTLASVAKAFERLVARVDALAPVAIGRGDRLERDRAVRCLAELRRLDPLADITSACPEAVANDLSYVLGDRFQAEVVSATCHVCAATHGKGELVTGEWEATWDGYGSGGSTLSCPRKHVLHARVQWTVD